MMRLLSAEFDRLRSRRMVAVALLAVLLAVGGILFFVNDQVRPLPAAEQAAVQAEFDRAMEGWQTRCVEGSKGGTEQCDLPEMGDFGGPLSFADAGQDAVSLTVNIVGLVFFLVGASIIGAEYTTGAIGNWVTYLPRRGRVFASKLAALTVLAASVSVLAFGAVIAGTVALVRIHGGDPTDIQTLVVMGLRGVLIPVALAVVGFCVALLSRHTTAALGAMIAYLLLWMVRPSVTPVEWRDRVTQWSPEGNLRAILEGGYEYMQPVQRITAEGMLYDFIPKQVTMAQGLTYWGILLLVVAVTALTVFRRRDLT